MPKRKLTAKVKQLIKNKKGKVKQSDYSGEALTYLKKYRSLQKARKKKIDGTLLIGESKIPRNSELYRTIEAAAKIKGQTVKQFVKENPKAIENLAKKGSVTITRELDYVIKDIQALPRGKKVFINEREVSRVDAIFALQKLQMTNTNYSYIVVTLIEVRYDLKGNMYLDIPLPGDYEDLLDDIDEMIGDTEGDEAADDLWSNFLDQYEAIHYIKS
jgi:hypothetical protein